MLSPMAGIKMWVKVTSTFLGKVLNILKMEGMGYLLAPKSVLLRFSIFLYIKCCFPCRLRLYIYHIKQFWYFRGSHDTLTVNNPNLETEENAIMKSHHVSSDAIVPPTVNHPVKLRLHTRWPCVFTVTDNMIRTPVLYKLKKEQFLTDSEKFLTGITV